MLELPIDELYIELRTKPFTKENLNQQQNREEPKTVPLQSAFAKQRVLIEGVAGSGKSTFLQRVAFELSAADRPHPLPNFPLAGYFPIHIRINKLEEHIRDCRNMGKSNVRPGRDLLDWIAH